MAEICRSNVVLGARRLRQSRQRAVLDVVVIAVAFGGMYGIASACNAFELLVAFAETHEWLQIDELFPAMLLLPLALAIYSVRRWADLRSALQAYSDANHALQDRETALANVNAELRTSLEREREATVAAERANRAKSTFLAMMSHEIRTPLNGIIGMTDLLCDTPLNDEQEEFAGTIRSSGEGLLQIINDILDFSKIEAGRLDPEVTTFAPAQLVGEIVDLLSVAAATGGIELKALLDLPADDRFLGDAGRIRQILLNLVGNAIKFTPQGSVTIRGSVIGRDETEDRVLVRFDVCDTGIGIAPDALGRLFDPFVQADGSTTRRYGGTGLGLAISKRLVELLGGQIGVQSVEGVGSTFWFTLWLEHDRRPVSRGDVLGEPIDRGSRETASHGARVLLAEDNAVNQRVTSRLLERLGYQVDVVPDGQAAVEARQRFPYAAVLMDCQMPTMDGFEATRIIRRAEAADCHVPIIALTASALQGDRDQCLAAGMDDYAMKPVRQRDLASILRRWVTNGRGVQR